MTMVTHPSGSRDRLRGVDANLLLVLHALLADRNLTRAGERIAMSQPGMSSALTRLRAHFHDDLLVRVGRNFELTPLAEQLQPLVASALQSAETILGDQRGFDPRTSSRQFTVSMSEYAMSVLAQPLVAQIAEHAPHCTIALDALTLTHDHIERQLLRRDLVVAPLGFDFPGRVQPIYTDEPVCIVSSDNPHLRDGALTMKDLSEIPHAVAEFAPTQHRPLEFALEQFGLSQRRVGVRVTSLLSLPYAVAGTDLCAFVPHRLARRRAELLGLTIATTPLPSTQLTEGAHWHPGRDNDAAVTWLRELLYDIAVTVADDVPV